MPAEESEMTSPTAARSDLSPDVAPTASTPHEAPHAIAAMGTMPPDIAATAGALLDRLRQERPRVHAITNAAAQVFTANLLLAAGATPSLTVAPDEVADFTGRAGALLVNLGTLDADRRAAIPRAIATARTAGIPWVLDPVFVDSSPPRLDLARLCLAGSPAVLRCNAAEFASLSGRAASDEALRDFASAHGTVAALTGAIDRVAGGTRAVAIANGHPLMTRVTAMGCAATALVAAFAGLGADPFDAAASALLVVGIAGEVAAETARGPGTFQPAFLDALHHLDASAIAARARLT
jgi:hydroxyethylthiazole kinase